jgi:hypothetical protein
MFRAFWLASLGSNIGTCESVVKIVRLSVYHYTPVSGFIEQHSSVVFFTRYLVPSYSAIDIQATII